MSDINSDLQVTLDTSGIATVRALKDTNRTFVGFTIDRISGVTTEALSSFTINKGGLVSSGTSYTVTSGKTLRITSASATVINNGLTGNVYGRVRIRSSGTVLVSSPIILNIDIPAISYVAAIGPTGIGVTIPISIPDGSEIRSGNQVGISQIINSVNSLISVSVVGFEY